VDFLFAHFGQLDVGSHISRNHIVRHGFVECFVYSGVKMPDRGGGEVGFRGVESFQVSAG
jgi:hypothetical protein